MFSFLRFNKTDAGGNASRLWLLLPLLLIGVLLLLWGGEKQQTDIPEDPFPYAVESDELVVYQTYLENRVKELCASVAGVGEVTAVVTLKSGFSSCYATEESANGETYVILGSGASATGLFLSRTAPAVAGIGIVCTGGTSVEVRNELIALLSAAFDVPSNHIYVTARRA